MGLETPKILPQRLISLVAEEPLSPQKRHGIHNSATKKPRRSGAAHEVSGSTRRSHGISQRRSGAFNLFAPDRPACAWNRRGKGQQKVTEEHVHVSTYIPVANIKHFVHTMRHSNENTGSRLFVDFQLRRSRDVQAAENRREYGKIGRTVTGTAQPCRCFWLSSPCPESVGVSAWSQWSIWAVGGVKV
jgi:hypothetical protein